jgi:ATP-dependent helicase/nuclease subunit B
MSKIITIPFTEPFIERLADHIQATYAVDSKDLRRLGIVFGGRRPALFLKRALARRIKGVFYPPRIFTIDEFMGQVTAAQPRQRLFDLDHCFVVYELVRQHAPHILEGKEEFVHFLPWAREILNFIEQLDLEDTSANALEVLKEHAVLGFNVPASINRLLEALMLLRQKYNEYMDQRGFMSRGYQYLRASQMVENSSFAEFDQILFCNFFYLHRTEMAVIKQLYKKGKASLLMQGDQRRWPALKRIASEFGQEVVEGQDVVPTTFNLKVYAASDLHAQAAIVGEILKNNTQLDKTVIVLPNPDAMLPLLSAIGAQLEDFNISLGYPLRRSSLYTLLETIVQAHKTMKGPLYYSRDYLRVLRHPLVKSLSLELPDGAVRVLVHKLEEVLTGSIVSGLSGQVFISLEDITADERLFEETETSLKAMDIVTTTAHLKKAMGQLHQSLFDHWQQVNSFKSLAQVIDHFCVLMQEHSRMQEYPLNQQVSARLQEIGQEWEATQFSGQPFDREDVLRIMQERLGREIIAFNGSPLRGLQVLGLLETRSLSFDHVIVLDVNEGMLPNLNIYEPLIPREVMIKMDLDRLELEEEIQRYQFMRLISGAKDVYLIYQERSDKERSRFIEELVWQEERKEAKIGAVPIKRPAFNTVLTKSQRCIPKTPEMVEYLKNFRFSASSVNMYLRNPYEFYQNYVLGVREKDDLLDDPQSRHIGTFVHDLLEASFKPMIGKVPVIDADFRKYFKAIFESRFHEYFGRGMKSDAFLIKAVLENRLDRFLEVEAKRLEEEVKEILFIERKFEDVLPLSCGPVRFSYRVDRVDRLKDGTILILDYKTGGSDAMPVCLDTCDPLSRELLRDEVQSFQMPLYLQYLDKQYPNEPVNAALYQLRTMTMAKFITAKTPLPRIELIADFMKGLDFLMCEIFNLEIPFMDDPVDIESNP